MDIEKITGTDTDTDADAGVGAGMDSPCKLPSFPRSQSLGIGADGDSLSALFDAHCAPDGKMDAGHLKELLAGLGRKVSDQVGAYFHDSNVGDLHECFPMKS